uniref:Secreted protein n=1 Tax=Periophthalmus magnuspinnatus TaxID=409849 RepID=A0A3B4A1Y9_9GOBI
MAVLVIEMLLCYQVHSGELGTGPLGALHRHGVPRGDCGSGGKHHQTLPPRRPHTQLHLHGTFNKKCRFY